MTTGKVDKIQRQCSHLKAKLEQVYELILDIQGLYLDQEEGEELIDSWTIETKRGLKQFEDAIEKMNLRITEEEQEAERGKQIRKRQFTLELEVEERKNYKTMEYGRQILPG